MNSYSADANYLIQTNGELEPALHQEWVLTNGIGSFTGSSIVGANTRRSHGLLCAATQPPLGRVMTLRRTGEILKLDGGDQPTQTPVNCFAGRKLHPRSESFLR